MEHFLFKVNHRGNVIMDWVNVDKVSSIVKITWTSVIGSIMEGEPEDEVSSTVVINGRIQTSSKSYSGKIQDEKDI